MFGRRTIRCSARRRMFLMTLLGCCILLAVANLIRLLQAPHTRKHYRGRAGNSRANGKNGAPYTGMRRRKDSKSERLNQNYSTETFDRQPFANIQQKGMHLDIFRNKSWSIVHQMKSPDDISQYNKTPNSKQNLTVHFLLGEDSSHFEIHNFLSVWSVMKYIRPCKVMFHCHVIPMTTPWWRRTLQITPNRTIIPLNTSGKYSRDTPNTRDMVWKHGGVIVTPNIVFLRHLQDLQRFEMLAYINKDNVGMLYLSNVSSTKDVADLIDDTYKKGQIDFRNIIGHIEKRNLLRHEQEDSWMCLNDAQLPAADNLLRNKTLVSIDVTYTAYNPPPTLDNIYRSSTQMAAIGRQVLFESTAKVERSVPNVFHYLWKEGRVRDLNMMELLSIKSVYHFANPKEIRFYGTVTPSGPRWDDVMKLPSFTFIQTDPPVSRDSCMVCEILHDHGGTFINFDVILTEGADIFRLGYSVRLGTKGSESNIRIDFGHRLQILTKEEFQKQQHHGCSNVVMSMAKGHYFAVICPQVIHVGNSKGITSCLNSTFLQISSPDYIIQNVRKTSVASVTGCVGEVARYVLFGETNAFTEETYLVPNVIHYIWFGKETHFHLHMFLCIYSAFINQKPDHIFFHYDHLPKGTWWQTLTFAVNLTLVRTAPPTSVFGRPINVVEHQSDVARLEILRKYGGIYLDIDVFVINSLDPLRTHSFVMAEEQPSTLGNGIILSEKNSKFLELYLNSYKRFNDSFWGYNSVVMPYSIMLHNRNLIHLGPRDRILKPDWSTCLDDIWYPESKYYWQDNYILHLYCKMNVDRDLPFMDSLISTPRFATSTFGQIANIVYKHFKRTVGH
ncbi:uncharacterized protein [Haliotis cracherodii]|uniref:uncharacterized protein n=1 Tax=Haliotis cracherodii TaxID=6455 RepID=UPI0039EC1B61